jgi:osmoprotectant transport system permease protein
MSEAISYLLENLPDYLGGHMLVSIVALAVGLLVSIPLGIWASRRPVVAEYLLGGAGVLQTVPTLALLALMVPILGGTIGFAPAFVALTLYSFLPILANTVTGIRGIDPTLTEAGRGLGMSERQLLLRVQLPLAAPVILSGIRTAMVLVVGTATLATPVGGKSLGNYIFSGMEMHNMTVTIFGCVLAAALAIGMDQLIHLLELAYARRSKQLAWGALVGLGAVVGGGLYSPITRLFTPPPAVVASGPFTEQHILSEVVREKLQAAGFRVDQRTSMGESIQLFALQYDRVDCCVNYTGNFWSTVMGKTEPADSDTIYRGTVAFLKETHGVECLGKLGFQNNYAFAMRKKDADRLKITTLKNLAEHSKHFKIASDLQFFQRPEWDSVSKAYGLQFSETTAMEPSLMYDAIDQHKLDVICAYSTDARIAKFDLVLLDDPRNVLPTYDAILLVSRKGMANARLREALLPLVREELDQEKMRRANMRVDVDGRMPNFAARELLAALARK